MTCRQAGVAIYPIEPALPVPRPRRDREARRDVGIQLFSLLMNASLCITASCHARSGPGIASSRLAARRRDSQ
jgi:hypothetical protein